MDSQKQRKLPHHCYVGKEIVSINLESTDRPKEGATCTVFLSNLYVEDTNNFLHSEYFKPNVDIRDLTIIIGEADCELDRGLEQALLCMVAGEESKITLLLNDQEIRVFVKLLKFNNTSAIFELTDEKKLLIATKHKEKGNELFYKKRYVDAFHRFSKAIKLIIFIMDENFLNKDNLYLSLCNNMAACQLHFRNFQYVVDLCDKVLKETPDNLKSLIRRMNAYIALRDFEKAQRDALKILSMEPTNSYSIKKLELINKNLAHQHVQYVKMVKQMFG